MKKILCSLVAFFVCASFINAQNHAGTGWCGHDLIINSMEAAHPGYQTAINQTFEDAKRYAQNNSRSNDVLRIRTVVHIVWKTPEENLADSVIYAQMDVLNEDFRRMNLDAINTRTEFLPVVGDPMIEFELVDIIRVQTTTDFELDILSGTLPDKMKKTAEGGSDALDPSTHLNIWVCNVQSGALGEILGFAFPPDGLTNWPAGSSAPSPEVDGVVIHYPAFGPNNPTPIMNYEVKGRTLVHEIGHYLGLRHIWGDVLFHFPPLFDGCAEDDGVTDTPNAATNSQIEGCDFAKNSCDEGSGDLPDMVENYMDYSVESCQNSFTIGQIDIMQGVLGTSRSGIVIEEQVGLNSANELATAMNVYPNPMNDFVQVNIENMETGNYALSVKNVLGQEIIPSIETSNNEPSYTLDLRNQSSGIYFIQLSNAQGQITKKIIKE